LTPTFEPAATRPADTARATRLPASTWQSLPATSMPGEPVFARGHDLLPSASGDPGGPHPGQQVDVGLVLGQHHRTVG
jgi:hypothetical protein